MSGASWELPPPELRGHPVPALEVSVLRHLPLGPTGTPGVAAEPPEAMAALGELARRARAAGLGEAGEAEPRTAVMAALELVLDVAYHEGEPYDLALAAEAWQLAGYNDGSLEVSHARRDVVLERLAAARKGRRRLQLQCRAQGLLLALTALAEAGLYTYSTAAEAKRLRWLARGGHDHEGDA